MILYKSMKYIYLLSFIFTFCSFTFSQDNIEIDSNSYPWFSPSMNYIQFYSKNSISNFYEGLNNSKNNKTSIIHFGDSHIQSEIPTNETRILLQKKYGNGGRGIVFPYSTAKTYSSIHYSTKHTGNWVYLKSTKPSNEFPIGIMGISSKTIDSTASFTITFNAKIPSSNSSLKIYCETDSLSFDLLVETDDQSTPIDIFSTNQNKGFITINIPSISNTITFKCLKTSNLQKQFIIHGFELINVENNGLIYHSSGVGGAKFNSLLSIDNFNKHLKTIKPDLVILDFGTNDFLFTDSIKPSLENEIKTIIATIRKTSPLTSIILCSTQDLYYKQKNINSTVIFSDLIKKIAKETETAYWDWFSVSGGKGSLKIWLNQSLAKTDMIHLTNVGYRIKGKLLFEAIENTKKQLFKYPNNNELVISTIPKKITSITLNDSSQKTINSLMNRETITEEKTNEISKENDFQKQINIQDSITLTAMKQKINDSIELKTKNINQSLKDTSTSLQQTNITPITSESIPEKHLTLDSINKLKKIEPKTTADVFRTAPSHDTLNNIISKTKKNNIEPKISNKSIKLEIFEDINDTLEIKPDSKKIVNKTNNSKKNYEVARERQYQILEHDTLALKILTKDSLLLYQQIKTKTKTIQQKKIRNTYYTIKEGDNLSYIADKYNVKISDIKTWNRLKSDNLSIGQKIIIKK